MNEEAFANARLRAGAVGCAEMMGVGSEVYGAVKLGRKGVGIELKSSYYAQAVKNVADALANRGEQGLLL